jgi:AcrR family transcriptional regulator
MKAPAKRKKLSNPDTKAKIVSAALEVFAEHGYSQASTRDIAAKAGVSHMLLFRYFDSKAALFEAALRAALPTELSYPEELGSLGELFAHFFTHATDSKATAIVAMCIGDAQARKITQRVTEEQIVKPLAAGLSRPNARERAIEILMLTVGFVIYTRFIELSREGTASRKKLMAWFAENVQSIVDG